MFNFILLVLVAAFRTRWQFARENLALHHRLEALQRASRRSKPLSLPESPSVLSLWSFKRRVFDHTIPPPPAIGKIREQGWGQSGISRALARAGRFGAGDADRGNADKGADLVASGPHGLVGSDRHRPAALSGTILCSIELP